jgi:hypothetical protein
MARMSPGVLVDHGADWLPFVMPLEEPATPATPAVIEIGRRSMLARLMAAIRRLVGK